MKVIFLGAGASFSAGYPLISNLIMEIEREVKRSRDLQMEKDWEKFIEFQKSAEGIMSVIVNSPNPEVILTLPDLLEATLNEQDLDRWKNLKQAWIRKDQDQINKINRTWDDPTRDELRKGMEARNSYLRCLDGFLMRRHWDDSQDANCHKRNHLKAFLSGLKPGDVVLTTNWDTVVERVLLEDLRWLPTDGYGFPANVVDLAGQPLPPWTSGPSPIKILKLHGSYGWYQDEDQKIFYLLYANFLQYLHLQKGGEEIFYKDKNEPPDYDPYQRHVLIYPSYLKHFDTPFLQIIWYKAQHALRDAEEVTVLGYSLPEADVMIRVLLNPLRQLLCDKEIKIKVIDPSQNTLNRWKDFLGEGIDLIKKRIEEL